MFRLIPADADGLPAGMKIATEFDVNSHFSKDHIKLDSELHLLQSNRNKPNKPNLASDVFELFHDDPF